MPHFCGLQTAGCPTVTDADTGQERLQGSRHVAAAGLGHCLQQSHCQCDLTSVNVRTEEEPVQTLQSLTAARYWAARPFASPGLLCSASEKLLAALSQLPASMLCIPRSNCVFFCVLPGPARQLGHYSQCQAECVLVKYLMVSSQRLIGERRRPHTGVPMKFLMSVQSSVHLNLRRIGHTWCFCLRHRWQRSNIWHGRSSTCFCVCPWFSEEVIRDHGWRHWCSLQP